MERLVDIPDLTAEPGARLAFLDRAHGADAVRNARRAPNARVSEPFPDERVEFFGCFHE